MKNEQISAEGIIISIRDYREYDEIITAITQGGKIDFIARGIKKMKSKNASTLQLFCHSNLHLTKTNSSLCTLIKGDVKNTYKNIRSDLWKQSIASFFSEVIYRIFENEFEVSLFHILEFCLQHLNIENESNLILGLFQSQINKALGIQANVDNCNICHKTSNIVGFSVQQGGFICGDCLHHDYTCALDKKDLVILRALIKADINHYEILKSHYHITYQHFKMLWDFFYEYSGISIKSIYFLDELEILANK